MALLMSLAVSFEISIGNQKHTITPEALFQETKSIPHWGVDLVSWERANLKKEEPYGRTILKSFGF